MAITTKQQRRLEALQQSLVVIAITRFYYFERLVIAVLIKRRCLKVIIGQYLSKIQSYLAPAFGGGEGLSTSQRRRIRMLGVGF